MAPVQNTTDEAVLSVAGWRNVRFVTMFYRDDLEAVDYNLYDGHGGLVDGGVAEGLPIYDDIKNSILDTLDFAMFGMVPTGKKIGWKICGHSIEEFEDAVENGKLSIFDRVRNLPWNEMIAN